MMMGDRYRAGRYFGLVVMTGRRYEFAIKFVELTGNVLPIKTFLNFVVGIGGKGGSKRSVAHQLLNRRGDLFWLVWPY